MNQWKKAPAVGLLLGICILMLGLPGCGEGKRAKESYEKGLEYLKAEEYSEARQVFKEAVLDKDNKKTVTANKKAYYGTGVAAFYLGDYSEAEDNFSKALEIEYLPEWNIEILKYQLDTQMNQKEYEAALETVKKAREEEEKDFALFWKEYFLKTKCESAKDAEEFLYEGLKIKGFGMSYQFDHAKIYYYLGNLTKAQEGMEDALKKEKWESYYYLGSICEDRDEYEAALEQYKQYLGKYKEAPGEMTGFVFNKMGYCYEQLGEREQALKIYEEGILFGQKESVWDKSFLQELKFNEITALEKEYKFEEASEKCEAYLKEYPEDKVMKREYEFLKTR